MDTESMSRPSAGVLVRCVLGGTLMGLANLVPGISGGTMLLAAGIYPRFIGAISAVTRLRLGAGPILVLGSVVGAALVAIALGAGLLKDFVVEQRWAAYALFIGLTLGGVPALWALVRASRDPRPMATVWVGAAVGFVAMAALALAQQSGAGAGGAGGGSFGMLLLAGTAGAAAMILPGVSGGYLLLVLGQYVPILSAIDGAKDAAAARDLAGVLDPALSVFVPVGIGVIVGVVGVSNLLRVLLARFEKPTLGVLLGLLLGAVIGLWPFQRGVEPQVGDIIKGEAVTAETRGAIEPEDWALEFFRPSAAQAGGAAALLALGFGVTVAVSWLGRERRRDEPAGDQAAG